MDVADRMGRLGTESAFEVLARARALEAPGQQRRHLEIGEPDFDTPANIVEAARQGARARATRTTGRRPASPSCATAIADDVHARRAASRRTPDEVVVTPGAKPIMFFAILALVEQGDEVVYPNPASRSTSR